MECCPEECTSMGKELHALHALCSGSFSCKEPFDPWVSRTCYAQLSLKRTASPEEIKVAYKCRMPVRLMGNIVPFSQQIESSGSELAVQVPDNDTGTTSGQGGAFEEGSVSADGSVQLH